METFSERLRQLRKDNNITLKELAKEIEVTDATLSRYQNDVRKPNIDIIIKIANYFEVSIDYLLGKSNEPKTAEEIKKSLSDDPNIRKFIDKINTRNDLKTLVHMVQNKNTKEIKQIINVIEALDRE